MHHHGGGRVEEQEQQGHAPQPAQGYTPHLLEMPGNGVDGDPLKFKWDGLVQVACQRLAMALCREREQNRITGWTGIGVLYQIC